MVVSDVDLDEEIGVAESVVTGCWWEGLHS